MAEFAGGAMFKWSLDKALHSVLDCKWCKNSAVHVVTSVYHLATSTLTLHCVVACDARIPAF